MKLNQDIFYPKENLHIDVTVENDRAKKPIENMAAKLVRRLVIQDNKKKEIFNDFVVA